MKLNTFLLTRLTNQKLTASGFKHPHDLVSWMGAIQAQDFQLSQWAVGLRTKAATESDIKKAIDDGSVLRTHVLRPTWHLVSSADIHWMLELTAPRIKKSLISRHRELELTEPLLRKSCRILERILSENEFVSREDIASEFRKNKIKTDENRLSHILFSAELDALICSGKIKNNRHTYSLLQKRIQKKQSISREEALYRLAERYFQSHSPASIEDFSWWSGLSVTDAKSAVGSISSQLSSEIINNKQYYFISGSSLADKLPKAILLPAYDEFIISYKNRSHIFNSGKHKNVISSNGLFRPVLLINGIISGIWKRKIHKDKVRIEIDMFNKSDGMIKKHINDAAETYGEYLNKEVSLNINSAVYPV
jgi:hypothetical protein